jgi:hypothetical protein
MPLVANGSVEAIAVATVTRHSPSRCLREIGRYVVIGDERQHARALRSLVAQARHHPEQ